MRTRFGPLAVRGATLRLTAVVLLAALFVLPAAPASAHAAAGAEAANYRTTIHGVVTRDEAAEPVSLPEGVNWNVRAAGNVLEVENTSDTVLLVDGYQDEAYLRIGPDGVEENRLAPTVYQNTDRLDPEAAAIPPEAHPDAEPEWTPISEEPLARWHDHRVHWMARTPPPLARTNPQQAHVIFEWSVPFQLDGQELALTGELEWVPSVSPWPWLGLGMLIVVAPPLLARHRAVSTAAATVVATGVTGAALAVDDVLTVPAVSGLGEDTVATVVTLGLPIVATAVAAAAGMVARRRSGSAQLVWLGAAAAAVFVGVGLARSGVFDPRMPAMSASQLIGSLPDPVIRVVSASALCLPATVAVAWWMGRRDGRANTSTQNSVAAAVLMVLLAACTGPGEPVETAQCAAPEQPPLQAGSHLLGDNEPPVPWSSVPPTSGWHASGIFEIAMHDEDDPLPEALQVSVLEAGAAVVTYHDLDDDQEHELHAHVASEWPEHVALTPYQQLEPGEVAFTAWGLKQVCDGTDLEALDRFVATHAADNPATPGSHD